MLKDNLIKNILSIYDSFTLIVNREGKLLYISSYINNEFISLGTLSSSSISKNDFLIKFLEILNILTNGKNIKIKKVEKNIYKIEIIKEIKV